MPRPLARVLELLEILQAGGIHKLTALSDRLGVDERTIRRYVGHLIDVGIPIEAERGRHGGYRLAAGFRLPPLMLTDDEALAVLLGLAARASGSADAGAGGNATAKILRVLPAPSRERFEALLITADLGDATRSLNPADAATPDTAILLAVAEAAGARRPLLIHYADRDERRSHRIVLPYGLVARAGRWYLSGADSLSGEVRTFRVDRISAAAPQDGVFEVPPGVDPTGRGAAGAGAPWRHHVVVRVEGTAEYVRSRLPEGLATVRELDLADQPGGGRSSMEGWVVVELRAERLGWVPAVLAGLDRPFVVDAPLELRDQVRQLGERLVVIAAG